MASKTAYAQYWRNGVEACVGGGADFWQIDSYSTEAAYLFVKPTAMGIPVGSTITNIRIDFQYRQTTYQDKGGIGYSSTFYWRPVYVSSPSISGTSVSGTITEVGSQETIKSKFGLSTSYTSVSNKNQNISVSVSDNTIVGVKFTLDSDNLFDVRLWLQSVSFTVTYTTPTYTVTWKNHDGTVLETDTGVTSGTTPTYNGATPTKSATAQYTYSFSGWSPSVGAITGNTTYTAQFTATVRKYTVSTAVSPSGSGTVTGADTYEYGKPATLTATPKTGYKFIKWSDGVTTASRTVTVTGNATYTAYFELDKINNILADTSQSSGVLADTTEVSEILADTTKVYG